METHTYRQFATVREVVENGFMLHVFGDVDLCEATEFGKAIDEAAADGDSVVVNLTQCRYIDSAGLATLVRAGKRFGTRFSLLVAQKSQAALVLGITEIDTVISTSYVDVAALVWG